MKKLIQVAILICLVGIFVLAAPACQSVKSGDTASSAESASSNSAVAAEELALLPSQEVDAFLCYAWAVGRYSHLYKDAPKDASELAAAPSCLFFSVPFQLEGISREGDYVVYSYELVTYETEAQLIDDPQFIKERGKQYISRPVPGTEKLVKKTSRFPIPGTSAYEESDRGQREQIWPKLAEAGVLGELETMQMEAKTEEERFFLRWAYFLAKEVSMLRSSFEHINLRQPASFAELAAFAGGINEPGWINPLTGERLRVKEGPEPAGDALQFYIDEEKGQVIVRMPTLGVVSQDFIEVIDRTGC